MPHETEAAAVADALADELRAILDALTSRSSAPGELAELTRIARGMRERLEAGAPRTRWYDSGGDAQELSAASRRAYLEQSPIRGRQNPVAPPLVFEALTRPDGSPGVTASARLGPRYEGPPHGVHGGWVAALFDEVLGTAQSLGGPPGVTALLKVRYRHVTPLDETLRFEGWLAETRGTRRTARATCHAGDTLTADAEGIFVVVDFDEVRERMSARRRSG